MTSVLSAILIFVVVYTLLRAPDPQDGHLIRVGNISRSAHLPF